MAALSSKCALAGKSLNRTTPFTSARPAVAPRQIVVKAQHVRDAYLRKIGCPPACMI